MSTDWKEIAERAQAALEEGQKRREQIDKLEDRHVEREQRRRMTAATVAKRDPPVPEPTPAEKKAAAVGGLFAWITQQQATPVEEPAKATAPDTDETQKPVAGTKAAKRLKRETIASAEAEDRAAAIETLARFCGKGTKW